MSAVPSADERYSFETDGFLVVESFLEPTAEALSGFDTPRGVSVGAGSAGQRQYDGGCHRRHWSVEAAEVADNAAMLACPIPAGLWVELMHGGLLRADAPHSSLTMWYG